MKQTIITATFIGANGSLGYENGKEYELSAGPAHSKSDTAHIKIKRIGSRVGDCVYSDISTFFQNWTNIKTKII